MPTVSEKWYEEYRKIPYMEHLSASELEERAKDLFNLLMVLEPSGKLGVLTGSNMKVDLWGKWTHVLAEMSRRYGPYPNGFKNGFIKTANIVEPTYPKTPLSKLAIDKIGGARKGWLFKFSKKKYVQEMFEFGNFRLAPASYYDDPSLNAAVRDNELVFKGSINPKLKPFIKLDPSLANYGRVDYEIKGRTNYYVTCFSSSYSYREFDDFEADCCLVIKNPRLFIDRLINAGRRELPSFEGFAGGVKYFDPLLCDPSKVDVSFVKHFKYAYQNEYRAVWSPKLSMEELPIKFIQLGSLGDVAEMIEV
jgi:hypothetical protein